MYNIKLSIFLSFFLLTSFSQANENLLEKFHALKKIDTHVHIRYAGKEFLQKAVQDNFRVITIAVDKYDLTMQRDFMKLQKNNFPDETGYVTSFPMQDWDEPDWQEKTIAVLKKEFEQGAIGVKVWKNIGMVFKDKNGQFVMINNPKFDPVITFIESQGKTLIGHLGEPKDCWLPLQQMVSAGNRSYYKNNPQYHMFQHPDYPSYDDQISARDQMLEKHPNLRFVGAHLASIEWSPEELSKRLDKYPNMGVDLAGRLDDLQYLDQKSVRKLFLQYQNRIMYATDLSIQADSNPDALTKRMHEVWVRDWKYLATNEQVTIPGTELSLPGLGLPHAVLEKIYHKNAEKWFPELPR